MRVESNGRKRGWKITVEGGFYDRGSRSIPCSGVARKPYARPGLPKRGATIS
jgi:hypothetical protein